MAPQPTNTLANDQHKAWAATGKRYGIYGLNRYDIDKLRELAPSAEVLTHCCELADKQAGGGPAATWTHVIEILRADATQGAAVC